MQESGVLRKESVETKEQTGRGEGGHANYKFHSWANLVFTVVLEMEPMTRRSLHKQHHSSQQFKCSMKYTERVPLFDTLVCFAAQQNLALAIQRICDTSFGENPWNSE